MEKGEGLSLEQIQAFLEGSEGVAFRGARRAEIYEWVTNTLCQQEYWAQSRQGKGVLRSYIGKMTGLGRAQVRRLLSCYKKHGRVRARSCRRNQFPTRYTAEDIALLAEVDEAHEGLSGPATQKLLYRAYFEYDEARYERLASISIAHIYNLRKKRGYREKRWVYQ